MMNLPKPGIENWTKPNATGKQLDSLRKSVSAAKAQTTERTRPVSRITETHAVDSTAQLSLATPARRELLEQWKREKKCATPKRVLAPPGTPEHAAAIARPNTPVLHRNKKLLRLHVKSTATGTNAREELAALIQDDAADTQAISMITTMPDYWIARSRVEQRARLWLRSLEMLVIGYSRGSDPSTPLYTEASAILNKMTLWVAEERAAVIAARDANDRPLFSQRKRDLQQVAAGLKRFYAHEFCNPALVNEAQLVIDTICVNLPPRARKQDVETATSDLHEESAATASTEAIPVQRQVVRPFFTADQVAEALAQVKITDLGVVPKSTATRISAPPADSPEGQPMPMDEEDWRSPESALASGTEEVETFKAPARARPEITPVRFGPTLVAPEIYTSKLATPVTKRGVPIMNEEDFKSPEPPTEAGIVVTEAPITPIHVNAGKKIRRRRSLVLKSPGPSFSAQPERVPATEEFLAARKAAREQREAAFVAQEQYEWDMNCYEDLDVDEEEAFGAPMDVKPSFSKLPQSFPISSLPKVKHEQLRPAKEQTQRELQGSLLVITPARTTKKEREALGSERKLAAVRRSSRFLASAAQELHPELVSVEKPEEFDRVLEEYDYIYTPNPKLLTKKRPTQMLVNQMAARSLSKSDSKDDDSMEELDPMNQEEEMVEVTATLALDTSEADLKEGGRYREVIPAATGKQNKKTCLTPVVRSTRLAQKRLQKNKE